MAPGTVLAYLGVIAVLIAVPGPDWAFVLANGVRDRVVVPAVAGIMLGYALLTAVVAAGVGVLVARFDIALTVLTVAGAAYLGGLGIGLLRHPSQIRGEEAAPRTRWARVLRGVGVSALNPKGLLLFLAILPQFTDAAADWPMPAQLAALGGLFVLTCGAFYLALGFAARTVLGARAGLARIVSRISGGAMVAIAVLLLVEAALG